MYLQSYYSFGISIGYEGISRLLLASDILLNITTEYILRLSLGRFGTCFRNLWDNHCPKDTPDNVIKN